MLVMVASEVVLPLATNACLEHHFGLLPGVLRGHTSVYLIVRKTHLIDNQDWIIGWILLIHRRLEIVLVYREHALLVNQVCAAQIVGQLAPLANSYHGMGLLQIVVDFLCLWSQLESHPINSDFPANILLWTVLEYSHQLFGADEVIHAGWWLICWWRALKHNVWRAFMLHRPSSLTLLI